MRGSLKTCTNSWWARVADTVTKKMLCLAKSHWEVFHAHPVRRILSTWWARKLISCHGISFHSEIQRKESPVSVKVSQRCSQWLTRNNCLATNKFTARCKTITWTNTNSSKWKTPSTSPTIRWQPRIKWLEKPTQSFPRPSIHASSPQTERDLVPQATGKRICLSSAAKRNETSFAN